jgi:hypothetical protein
METDMKREEAIEALKKKLDYYESDKRLKAACETLIPELRESEDEKMLKRIRLCLDECVHSDIIRDYERDECVAYLEKQKESLHVSKTCKEKSESFTDEDERIRKDLIAFLIDLKDGNVGCFPSQSLYQRWIAWLEKQKEQDKCPEYCVRSHCIGCPIYEKQKEQKSSDEYIRRNSKELHTLLTKKYDEGFWKGKEAALKEQKPVESISQLTVQGKGVYKICPHCKERMVRDDSKVYTSMPPQYGYNCPKCGAMEFDTVMYDNPEMEEQKPIQTSEKKEYIRTLKSLISDFIRDKQPEDVAYYQRIYDWLDGRHIEQKPAEYLSKRKVYDIMNKLTELSTSDLIPVESEEYVKIHEITSDVCGLLDYPIEQKPVEIHIDNPNIHKFDPDVKITTSDSSADGKELLYVSNKSYDIGFRDGVASVKPAEWSEEKEEQKSVKDKIIEDTISYLNGGMLFFNSMEELKYRSNLAYRLKSLRPQPHWKPSKWRHYIWAVNLRFNYDGLVRYEDNGSYEIVTAGDKPKRQVNGEYILLKDISSYNWKPSEEQIGALNYAYCELFKRGDVGHNILGSLQNLIDTLRKL